MVRKAVLNMPPPQPNTVVLFVYVGVLKFKFRKCGSVFVGGEGNACNFGGNRRSGYFGLVYPRDWPKSDQHSISGETTRN